MLHPVARALGINAHIVGDLGPVHPFLGHFGNGPKPMVAIPEHVLRHQLPPQVVPTNGQNRTWCLL